MADAPLPFLLMGVPLEPGRFAIIDFETTAIEPGPQGRILEVGIVLLEATPSTRDGQTPLEFLVTDTWDTLVNPGPGVGVGATHIHHITEDMVRDAPAFDEVAGEILGRLSNTVIVAHNARFDVGFLESDCRQANIALPELAVVCTLELARYVSQRAGEDHRRHTLAACCERAEIPFPEHDQHSALGDAAVTAQLLGHLVGRLEGFGEQLSTAVPPPAIAAPPTSGRRVTRQSALSLQQPTSHQPRLFDEPRSL